MAVHDNIRAMVGPGQQVRYLDICGWGSARSAGKIVNRANEAALRDGHKDERYWCVYRGHEFDPVVGRWSRDLALFAYNSGRRIAFAWRDVRSDLPPSKVVAECLAQVT